MFSIGAIFGGLFFLGVFYYIQNTSYVQIPSIEELKNLKVTEVSKILKKEGLQTEKFFGGGNLKLIIPESGSLVKRGRKIQIYGNQEINEGIFIPNLYGVHYLIGVDILKNLGLNVNLVKINYPGGDGRILASYPSFESTISNLEKINLLVDNGEIGGSEWEEKALL